MDDIKIRFLQKALLGRTTDFGSADSVIDACIRKAYQDMLIGGRYYISNGMELRCDGLKHILEESGYAYAREHIESALPLFGEAEVLGAGNRYVTRYGLAQKFVNMAYKYFYIFDEYFDGNINYTVCDCPLDSVVLGKLPPIKNPWTKLTRDEYMRCQDAISERLEERRGEYGALGNLAFDFSVW